VAGSFPLTFTVTDSSNPAKSASSNFTLAVANTPLVFTSFTMPTAVAGKPYTQTLPVAGGTQPYNGTVTIGTPPPGLTLVGNVLTGTPSGTGTFTFTVTVTDSSTPTQTATRTLTIAVNTLVITTTALPSGIVGVPYNAAISTTGGTPPLSYSLATAAFPPGLSIQQGALAGTPTQAGNFFFSETVVDSSTPAQTATQNYEVTIAPLGTPAPANVTFVSQPQNSVGGQTLSGGSVVVRVTDASNNPIPGTTVAMTLGGPFHTPPACSVATLSGTLTAVTDATGQVTFSNLSVDRGGFNYALLASTGSASQNSGPFSVQGFCASGNLSTQREGHTQDLLGTAQSTFKFRLDPKGTYLFTNTNPAPPGVPDIPDAPLIIPLASLGIQPGNVISGMAVGDMADCAVGSFCFGEVFNQFTCAVFSTSNTLLSTGGTINRVPGAITPDFTTAFPCSTPTTLNGNLPTDIPQDFALFGERVIVPPGAAYLFVGVIDTFYSDNSDPNGDFGVEITVNSPTGVNRNVLIAGGADNSGNVLNTAELYHPLLGFSSPTGNLTAPNGRANHVSVVLPNGQVLLIGGLDNAGGALATAELYNPATGTFAATGSMSRPRTGTAAVLLADGRVLVSGGFNTSVATNTAEIYDPATGLWTPTGNMNQGRARHAMTLLPNGKVLVTGGRDTEFNFNSLASAEIFDPFANQGAGAFSAIGNMNSPRFKHTATLLSNGKVLIAGGFNDGNNSLSVASAELFDPNTNTFTPTGSMNIPRARHSSTLLPDGTVLETGAINGFNGLVAAAPAELYSPATGTFALTAQMITGREVADATLIPPNGNVLISGGDDGVNVLASTEVYYNPVAQTPVVITTTSVPNGFISQPYVQLLLEQNRSGPITWSLASGTLPPGITLSASGILFGTPTAVGSFTFSVQVTDGISTATTSYTINVSLSPLTFTSNTMPAAGSGKAYSQPLPVTGGTLPHTATLTAGTLPPGLALSTNGLITGTPSSAGSFTFTVNVTDSSTPAQSATQTLTIAVDTLFIVTTALPDGIIGVPYNAAISTVGGSLPLSFSLTSAAFPPGLAIQQPAVNSQSGALAGTPTLAGHYTFSETVVDSSSPAQTATQIYILDVLPAGTAIPAALTFTRQPQNSIGGQILGGSPVRVLVTDANNAPIVGASVAISFNGAPPCSTAVLSGTLTAITNGNGNAFFPDLSIDRGQLGYTLLASAGSATAVSLPFTVNGFCPTGDLTVARRYATATVLPSGKVLVTGGDPANGVNGSSSSELFDPTSGTFTLSGLMSNARAGHDATLLNNGQVLITGGRGPGGVGPGGNLASAELYNPTTGLFSPTGGMSTARYSPTSTLLADGRVLITGGDPGNNIFTNSAELYDPASGTFSQTGNLTVARGFHTAILLPDGKVLIAGGRDSSGPLSSVEIYDPVSGISNFAGNMSTPRSFHTATLLSNGKVLLAGGQTSSTGLASAELFDPATGTFSLTGSMLSASVESNANLLADGTALISDGFVFPSGISEIYDPSLGVFSATGNQVNGRIGNGAAVLANGQVLLTGGATPGPPTNPILNSAEIYYSTAPLAPISITTTSPLFSANVGTPFTQILLEQGGLGNLTWSETGTLPAGVTFSPQGVLSGTPTTTGSFPLTFTVTDSSTPTKTASRNFILTVTSGPVVLVITTSTLPGGTANTPYAANISSTGGVLPIGFAVTSGALPPGLSLALAATPPQTATLSGTPTTTGTFTFVVTATDASSPAATASASYTVTIAPLVVSSLVVQHSSPSIPVGSVQQFLALVTLPNGTTQNLTTSVTWSSSDTTKVTINNASGSQGFATAIASGTVTITANLNGVSGSAVLNVVSTPSAVTQFAYVANRTDNTISVDALSSAGGGLSPILGSPFAAGITAPNGLAVDPTARFLYVSTFGGPSLSGLAINGTTGALSPIPGSPFTQGSNPIFLAVDPTGRFVYTANLGSDNVSVFSIDSNTGALAATSGSPFPAGSQPHGVTIDPKGRFAYVANCGSGQGCTGTGSGSITGYALNSVTGAMTPVPGSPFLAGLNPFAVTVDPTGKFVYVANTSSSSVSAFTIDPNSGTLSALAGSPFQVGTQPGALTVDRAGKLLYVANGGSLNISGFTISPIDGSLTPIPGSPFQLGRIPTSVAVDATNQFLYASELGGVVEGFSINPATGALSSLGGFGVGNGSAFITTTEPPAITITLTLLRNASQNQPYNEVLLEQGGVGTLTWTLVANSSPLPPGLTLSSSGIISGTPTQFGAFPITVQVTDSSVPAKSATITYGLIVLPQLQFLGNQLVTAFSGTPYNNSLPLVGGTAPYTITLTMGTLPAGLVFTPASSTFPTGQISGTTTVVGNYTLTFQATDSSVPPQSTTGTLTLGVTTPLTITTTTLPNGSLGASYSAAISTTGGIGTVTFVPPSGARPPGVTIGYQGVLSGIPTSTGTFAFTVLGFDQSFPPQTASQTYTLTITTAVAPIVLSPDPLNLLANSSGTMSVTLSAAAGASGQAITLSSSNSSVASVPGSVTVLPQATTATFQVTAGTSTSNATVTASAAGFTSGNASVVVVGCPSSVNLTLCGRYSMGVVGFNSSGGPVAGGVTFVADNSGHIVSGIMKFNQSVAGPTTSTITGGSYVIDSSGDGRGVLTLTDSTSTSRTYRFVLESLANAGAAQVEEFDNSGTLVSGIIAGPETPPVPQIPPNTTVALNVKGINGSGQLAALLGEFQVGSGGCDGTAGSFNSLAGEPIVTNTAGTVNTALTATGSCTASDPNTGIGTAQITISGGTPFTNSTLNFVYVAVGTGTTLEGVFFLEVDPIAANQPILSGLAESVSVPAGGFNASTPVGCPCLLVQSGTTDGTTTTGHSVASIVRVQTTPGAGASGTLTGVLDQNAGGTITLAGAWPYTSYTVDSNGVGTVTGTGSPVHFIISGSGGNGFTVLTVDESVSVLTGSLRSQNATTIQTAGAPYIVGLGNGDFVGANRNVESAVGVITPSGTTSGTLTGTVDVISSAGSVVGATASGTYTIDSTTGRGTGTANLTGGTSSIPVVIYARRVRQFVVLDVQSSDPYLFGARLQ
jgi:6-phosphogluconolactonase (cycloisomerase 2 family)